jgi:hypothetical protein
MTKLFAIIAFLRRLTSIHEPWHEEAGLRQYFEVLIDGAELIGLPQVLVDKIQSAIDDPEVFQLALAVARFINGQYIDEFKLVSAAGALGDGAVVYEVSMEDGRDYQLDLADASAIDWLTIIPQIIAIIEQIRRWFQRPKEE